MRVRHLLRARLVLGTTVLLVGVAACTGSGDKATDRVAPAPTTTAVAPVGERPVTGSIEVYDQIGDGTKLVVKRASIEGAAGWVVVHMDEGGPGTVIACTAIPEGSTTDLAVQLTTKVGTGELWPMLHRDAGQPAVCEWPAGPDGPVRPPSGAISYATKKILLTVQTG